tara:strand:- start:115 stop:339 length:225 start_codon:yes stop_codon:yes gene_type:complete
MLWEQITPDLDDYVILKLAHTMLDSEEGLNEDQYDALKMFVYDQLGPTAEMLDLFDRVEATDGRFYVPAACKEN